MKQNSYKAHIAGISALFVLGEAGILLPYGSADERTFLGFLIAAAIRLITLAVWSYWLKKHLCTEPVGFKKLAVSVLFLLVIAFAVYTAVGAFSTFTDFVSVFILPETPEILTALLFAAVIIYLSLMRKEVFFKLSLTAFALSFIVLLVLFLLSIPNFEADNIILLSFPGIKDLTKQTLPYITNAFMPTLILPFYCIEAADKRDASGILPGATAGVVMLAITLLSSLLIFGSGLAGRIEYPYSEAIGTVTVGDIFTRMDGFSYFVFFFSCLIKVCVCIAVICSLGKRLIDFCSKKNDIHAEWV